MKIPDKFYKDFSGGIRRDKSPYDLKDNELRNGRNFEIDKRGRIVKRRGSLQFGQDLASIIQFHSDANGTFAANYHATQLVVYKLKSSTNDSALTTATTSIAVSPSGQFIAGPANAEINGDEFTYQSGGGGSPLATVTGISESHDATNIIQQWQTIGTLNGTRTPVSIDGCWFSFLNGLTVILAYNSVGSPASVMSTYDGSNIADVATLDVATKLLENFRDKIFTVSGNGSRVYYSNLGAVAFPTTIEDNSFDIEDQLGEPITAIKQYRKNLIIAKQSSMFAYPGSLPVRQLTTTWGVYNENCLQEVRGILYGIGPEGVFMSNGVSFVDIGEPVKEYIKSNLNIDYTDGSNVSDISLTRTAQFDNKFIIYINDFTDPETDTSATKLALVYDTVKKNWVIWRDISASSAFKSLTNFRSGNGAPGVIQRRPILLFSNGSEVYRMFENRTLQQVTAGGRTRGTDRFSDEYHDATGTPITMNVTTKPFDLGYPNWKKEFGYLKVFTERPQGMSISVIIDDGDPIPLGQCRGRINRFKFPPNTKGTRCAIIIDESSTTSSAIFNGCIFEECKTVDQNV